jgi:hypothetical protein
MQSGRAYFRKQDMAHRSRTAWLGWSDSNSEMSSQIIPLRGRTEISRNQPNSGHRDYARLSAVAETRSSGLVLPGSSGTVLRAPMSTLDAELNDFGAQLAMLGGHAADRDG